jgi:hypothetical protein
MTYSAFAVANFQHRWLDFDTVAISTNTDPAKKNPALWTGFNCITGTATLGELWDFSLWEISQCSFLLPRKMILY